MQIERLPVLSDNYIFVLWEAVERVAAVVDPAVAGPVVNFLERHSLQLTAIFNTHHHADHIGGNRQLLKQFPSMRVYGGVEDRGRLPGQTDFLREGDRVEFAGRTAEVYFVPGHTRAHIAYYFPPATRASADSEEATGELFVGDTLFAGGCGRLFEGTPAQMVNSLGKLRMLPDTTRVWCAHEYTLKNLQFAISIDPDNSDLQERFAAVEVARRALQPTVPSWLGVEKHTNPFLRWEAPALQQATRTNEPARTFARLRGMKDRF